MKKTRTALTFFSATLILFLSTGPALTGQAQDTTEKKGNEETIALKIIKNEDGKVTVIDTTFTAGREGAMYEYEFQHRNMDRELKCVEEQMRELEGQMRIGIDENLKQFNWQEGPDMFMPRQMLPDQLRTLLGSVPMGHIKGFKIKERKGYNRIIIDMDDDPVMIFAPAHRGMHQGPKRMIIQREIRQVPPPPPPPPPAEQGQPEDKTLPEKG